MNTELLIPNIKNTSICVHAFHTENSNWDWHIHDEYEIYMCLDGNVTFSFSDKVYYLGKGDIIFINCNIPHKTEVKHSCNTCFIQFKPVFNSNYVYLDLFNSRNSHCLFEHNSKINRLISVCISEILTEYTEHNPFFEDFIKADVHKILAILYRYDILTNPEHYYNTKELMQLIPVFEYINNNYMSKITLSDMSNLINVDKSYFCRLFKKAVGVSMIDYANTVRLSKAESLLISSKLSIGEICERTGFLSEAYFCKLFKRYKSCSPSKYRKLKNI